MKTHLKPPTQARALLLGASLWALCGGAALAQETPVAMNAGSDITTMCGDKPMRVVLVDGIGNNTWRRITAEEFADEAAKCPNITEVRYSDANGDQQKYNGDINSFVAQGFDAIVAFTDFGDAAIPAYRAAYSSGVTVVPYFTKLSGTDGQDYSRNIYQDLAYDGKLWADWMNTALGGKGNIVFLGGTAGAASSQQFLDGFKAAIAAYPDIKLLDENYIVTNWQPADAQKAVTGLIAKYPQIDGIVSDSGSVTYAAIKTFQQAGLPVPAQATIASTNEMNCKYLELKEQGTAWKYMSLDGTNRLVRFALRAAVADFQKTDNPNPSAVVPDSYVDSEAGVDPVCDPNAPPDADFSGGLPKEKLLEMLK